MGVYVLVEDKPMATTQTDVDAEDRVSMLKQILQSQSNEYGEVPNDAWVTITVSYENRNGNVSIKHGDVWRVTDDKINFSENAGEVDESSFYLEFGISGVSVVSVSEQGRKTDLGELSNIVIED